MRDTQHHSTQLTDEEIITLYKEGNVEVFKDLMNRYMSPLYNFTARITNKSEASDIVSETFIKVWKKLDHFDEKKASFKTWIFTIAKNTATDFLRKKHSLLFSDISNNTFGDKDGGRDINSFAENIPDEHILPDIALDKLKDKELLNNTLDRLSSNYREVLMLHYQEEMTFDKIGKILNKPLNTVKSQHKRAIAELHKLLS